MTAVSLIEYVSNSPEETLSLGERIAGFLSPPSIIALYGRLGSGKTQLVKGIAKGLNITENITSPTYTIINEYTPSDKNNFYHFYHIDAYRLNDEKDFLDIGGLEIIHSNAICAIEWSERISSHLPEETINISFEIIQSELNSSSRLIKITGMDKI